jgi:hypothetical protein
MQSAVQLILMYFVVPVWIGAGLVDWACHRRTHIERNAGPAETLLHLLMFAEVGLPLLMALFLEITSTVFVVMLVALVVHEATAWWDVHYASTRRVISPLEQHMHAFLEILPLTAVLLLAASHWDAFLAVFGMGPSAADMTLSGLRLKAEPLPAWYLAVLLASVFMPFVEELIRGLRWRRMQRGIPSHAYTQPDERLGR